jgi:FAD/FMN-containing dehydrogenase
MPYIDNHRTDWKNRHETFFDPIKNMYTLYNGVGDGLTSYNAITQELMALIKTAALENATLRALGAGWSWLQITTGGPNGIILDTKPLNTIFKVSDGRVLKSYKGTAAKLRFVQSGSSIWEINKALKLEGLSLKTTGASNGQTIAGVISTGAHGSAHQVGAIQEYVVGLHIVVSSTRHVYLERASSPVINQSFAKLFNAELIRDDDLFNAALVCFGSFGIIHGVMVETEDIFLLEGTLRKEDFGPNVLQLMQSLDFSNQTLAAIPNGTEIPYHFEVKLNPYDAEKKVLICTMYKRPFNTTYTPPKPNAEGLGPGDDAPAFIGKLLETIPALIPAAVNALAKSSLTLYEKGAATGTIGEIFSNTTLRGKLLSAAIGIPLDKIKDVIDVLIEVNADPAVGTFPGLYAFRFVKGSQATLAFTRFDKTCIVEMDGAFNERSIAYCNAVWDKLEQKGIPFTCHWGKQTNLTAARLDYMYGSTAINQWKAARNTLMDAESKKVFTNPIMVQWGLDK